jgi:DNA replication licensing factor MCM5
VCDMSGSRLIICRDQIRENVLVKQYYCDIDIAHLIVYNDELAQNLTQNPAEVIPRVC